MKKALISPNEEIYSNDGTSIGYRVAEVSDTIFEVSEPLFWLDCEDNVNSNTYYYDDVEEVIKKIPEPEVAPPEEV